MADETLRGYSPMGVKLEMGCLFLKTSRNQSQKSQKKKYSPGKKGLTVTQGMVELAIS